MESCAGNSWLCPPGKPWLIVVPDHRCLYFSSTRRHVLINARPSVSKIVTRYRHRPSSEIVNTTRPPASPPIPVTGIAPDTFGNNHRPWNTTRSNLKRHRHPRLPNSTTRQHDALSSCDCKSRRHPCPTIRDTSPPSSCAAPSARPTDRFELSELNTHNCVLRFTEPCKHHAHRSVFRPPRGYPRLVTFCAYLTSCLHCAIQISENAPLSCDDRT